MISIEISPCQFKKVAGIIQNEHPEANVTINGDNTGHVHTSQIDADYEYRQRTETIGTLVFENEVKHGVYKMVSDDTIGAYLTKLLSRIVCDEAVGSGSERWLGEGDDWTQSEGQGLTDNTNKASNFVKKAA